MIYVSCYDWHITLNMLEFKEKFLIRNVLPFYNIIHSVLGSNMTLNVSKEPSINDVASKGEGGGEQKWEFGAIFQGLSEATVRGRGVKKHEN